MSLKDAIARIVGETPTGVEENAGSLWFRLEDGWYSISIARVESLEASR